MIDKTSCVIFEVSKHDLPVYVLVKRVIFHLIVRPKLLLLLLPDIIVLKGNKTRLLLRLGNGVQVLDTFLCKFNFRDKLIPKNYREDEIIPYI